jgi:uncharacterized protein GlcG (DUF336 family)
MKVSSNFPALLAASVLPLLAQAQTPAAPPTPRPPARAPAAALAVEAAQQAVSVCAANGYKVGASVVDVDGGVRALVIADAGISMLGEFATRKAVAAVTFKQPTSRIEQQMKTDEALKARIASEPNKYFTRAGGVPIVVAGEVIGAIGVGGASESAQDEICAVAAIAKVQDRLK